MKFLCNKLFLGGAFQFYGISDSSSTVKLAQVFRLLEGIKESLDIEGYSVSQTTLDDVCIYFCDVFNISILFHRYLFILSINNVTSLYSVTMAHN